MKLYWKSAHTIKEARDLSERCGKPVGGRISVVSSTGVGMDAINETTDVPLNVNIVYIRKTLPLDFNEYKKGVVSNVARKLVNKPLIFSIENEALYFEQNFDLTMLTNMTKYNYGLWTPNDITVSNSGTGMPTAGGLTYDYYLITQGQRAADDFKRRWGSTWMATPEKTNLAHDEINIMKTLKMPNLLYTFHYNVNYESVNCITDVIDALRYYCGSWTVSCNEVSFRYQDADLVDRAMAHFQAANLPFVCAYSAVSDGWATLFTPEMEEAFLKYA